MTKIGTYENKVAGAARTSWLIISSYGWHALCSAGERVGDRRHLEDYDA